ncbi:hypothetical protein [Chryseobacterium indoltheticum]|uniref:Uncharacterized protein n=1 Tax=Chryseobacterium indoltheticum TaxID=254 RepID=A0A381FAP5_9FLAO|nr:hypothetical protein [Chryseobacterium indoltheticum]AZA73631.1 hypothetical protein EG358_07615 [Chryseobacterium indoltheticum]SIR22301.1 hypothetical protein SAMN05421682_11517 [Chryseobacterium indoltheticum]SUX43651.1 Uncharacterised protein [Chryseobacterium indoltheticum]
MFDSILSYFFPAIILSLMISVIYFFFEKRKIIKNYSVSNSKYLKNIRGLIISDGGYLQKKIQLCSFDLLINDNTIFIFPKSFYVIPMRKINLNFSNSDKKLTRSRILLREMKISNQSVDLISYPNYLQSKGRIIRLQNLTTEQISIFEEIKKNKNY